MGYGKRDFRYMAIPSFEGQLNTQTGKGSEILRAGDEGTLICIAAKNACENKEQQIELAKLFLQFVQSREQLSKSTKNMGACFRSYNFTATPEEIKGYTKYAQSVYKYIEEGCELYISGTNKAMIWEEQPNALQRWICMPETNYYDPFSFAYNMPKVSVNEMYEKIVQNAIAASGGV